MRERVLSQLSLEGEHQEPLAAYTSDTEVRGEGRNHLEYGDATHRLSP